MPTVFRHSWHALFDRVVERRALVHLLRHQRGEAARSERHGRPCRHLSPSLVLTRVASARAGDTVATFRRVSLEPLSRCGVK